MADTQTLQLVDCSNYALNSFRMTLKMKADKGVKRDYHSYELSRMIRHLEKLRFAGEPRLVACVFDATQRSFRGKLLSPKDIEKELNPIIEFVRLMGWKAVSLKDHWASSVIGSMARTAEKLGISVEIFSSDKSMVSLVSQYIEIVEPVSGKRYTPDTVRDEFGDSQNIAASLHLLTRFSADGGIEPSDLGASAVRELLIKCDPTNDFMESFNRAEVVTSAELNPTISKKTSSELNMEEEFVQNFAFLAPGPVQMRELPKFYGKYAIVDSALRYFDQWFREWMKNQVSTSGMLASNRHRLDYEHVVYRIKNVVTKRIYFGSSSQVDARWKQHSSGMQRKTHANHELSEDAETHGVDTFEYKILSRHPTRQQMLAREQLYISMYFGRGIYNYRPFVPIEDGLPFALHITAATAAKTRTTYKIEELYLEAKKRRNDVRSYWSIHAAARDLNISKKTLISALSELSTTIGNRIYYVTTAFCPNDEKLSPWLCGGGN